MKTFGVMLIENSVASQGERWPGGRGHFVAVATSFDNESVAFEFLGPDGSTWLGVPDLGGTDINLSANGSKPFELPPCTIRATVSTGGGAPTGLYVSAARVPY